MSFNICALSGKIATHPIVCLKTGYIFNKDLIEQYIKSTGKCPITHIELTMDDLMEIKGNSMPKPRNINDCSPNSLFNEFKEEFDSTVSEVSRLKRDIEDTKKELANESYKYEASINIINRLIQDKEIALNEVEKYREVLKK